MERVSVLKNVIFLAGVFVFVGLFMTAEQASACCDFGSGCEDDCPHFKPVCDPGADICYECIGSAQQACTAFGLVCGPQNECIKCNQNADCPGAQLCKNAGTSSSKCVDCLDDNQCGGSKPICGSNDTCRGCTGDTECFQKNPGEPVCNSGPCVECTGDEHCAMDEYCGGNNCQSCGCSQWCDMSRMCYDDMTCEIECFAEPCL